MFVCVLGGEATGRYSEHKHIDSHAPEPFSLAHCKWKDATQAEKKTQGVVKRVRKQQQEEGTVQVIVASNTMGLEVASRMG